jgi:hypothetical protein
MLSHSVNKITKGFWQVRKKWKHFPNFGIPRPTFSHALIQHIWICWSILTVYLIDNQPFIHYWHGNMYHIQLQLTPEGLTADSSTESHIKHKANESFVDQSFYIRRKSFVCASFINPITQFRITIVTNFLASTRCTNESCVLGHEGGSGLLFHYIMPVLWVLIIL